MDRHLSKDILFMDVIHNSRELHQKLHLTTAHLLGKVRGCGMAEMGPFCAARVVLHLPRVIGPCGLCLRWKEVAGCWGRCSAGVASLSAVGFAAVNDLPSSGHVGRARGVRESSSAPQDRTSPGPQLTEQPNRACSSAGITV